MKLRSFFLIIGIMFFPSLLFADTNTSQQNNHLNINHPLSTAFSLDNRMELNTSNSDDLQQFSSHAPLNTVLSDAKLVHFDSTSHQWESQSQTIKNMYQIQSIQTAGKYAFAYGWSSSENPMGTIDIAFYDGHTWTPAQTAQNLIDLMPNHLYYAYARTGEKPNAWIIGDESSSPTDFGVSYFDGKTFSPGISLPQFKNHRFAFLVSKHNAFVIDYTNNSIMTTTGTEWNSVTSLPAGTIVSVFAKDGDGDLYVLEYSPQNQNYFIVSLLKNQTWSTPITLMKLPNDQITSLMVVSVEGDTTGKTNILLLGKDPHDNHFHVLESTDNGQTWFDCGAMPDENAGNQGFTSNNGYTNYGNILWEYTEKNTPRIGLAYLNPAEKSPTGWTKVALSAPWEVMPLHYDPLTSFNGKQGWAEPYNGLNFYRLFYFDTDLQKLFSKSNVKALLLEPGDNGQVFGFGGSKGGYKGFYNDGKSISWNVIALPADMQSIPNENLSLSSHSKGLFVDSTNNVWIYQNNNF